MGGVSKDIIEEIRSRCDIVDVIGSYVQLKRAGSNTYKGLCPFHQEKTPSFHVDASRQMYHCFGCGKGGDVFRFFMDRENVGFYDALHMLASRVGVIIPEDSGGGERDREEERRRADARERLYRINETFAGLFYRHLVKHPDSPAARYLAGRGIPLEIAEKFKIGAVPDQWTACLDTGRKLGYSAEEMLAAGLVARKEETGRYYDQFKGRLAFAIENEHGRVVGFSARSLEAKPLNGRKYVNTPETAIFKKGNLLYALPLARKMMSEKNMAILCEGQLDTIAFHRAGFECAVAPQGTAFTENQARMLKRHANRIFLAFDADAAGQKAILRAVEILLPLSMEINVIRIPGGKDPDELFAHGGAAAVSAAVEGAVSWLRILCDGLPERFDFASPVGRASAVSEVVRYLRLVTNPVESEIYVRNTAEALGVSEEAVYSELRQAHLQERRAADFRRANDGESANVSATTSPAVEAERIAPALLTMLELALADENAARYLAEAVPHDELAASGAGGKALDLVINAALNGEHDHASQLLGDFLREHPVPALSAALVRETVYADREKALAESVSQWRRMRFRERRVALTNQLRAAADDEEKLRILGELQKLNQESLKQKR